MLTMFLNRNKIVSGCHDVNLPEEVLVAWERQHGV